MSSEDKIDILIVLCSILQIFGFVIFFFRQYPLVVHCLPVLTALAGFSGVVKFFLPYSSTGLENKTRPLAALAGMGMIILSFFPTMFFL